MSELIPLASEDQMSRSKKLVLSSVLYLVQGFYFVLYFVWSQQLNILTRPVTQGYPKDYILVQAKMSPL